MEFSTLEIIGLAFLSGLKIAKITEDIKEEGDDKEEVEAKCENKEVDNTDNAENIEKIETKRITPKEMGEIFDMLKNKVLGGKNNE